MSDRPTAPQVPAYVIDTVMAVQDINARLLARPTSQQYDGPERRKVAS